MIDKAKEILLSAKDFYEKNNFSNMQLNFSNDAQEKSLTLEALNYLETEGYINNVKKALGFCAFDLTPYCLSLFDEDNFDI